MAFPATVWYVNSTAYSSVTAWATGATIAAGALRRQLATPSVGNERVFVAIVGGTTHATTEPTWTVTRGAKNTDNTVTWQECTGQAAVNGDLTNTPNWNAVKNTAVTLGAIIKDVAGTHIFICSTAGTAGNGAEPTWSVGAVGNTTADNTVTWTYIGTSFSAAAAPHARIANADTTNWSQATETIYVGDNHAETSSAGTLTIGPGTSAGTNVPPKYILCHNHLGSYPPASGDLTTGATVTSSASGVTWSCVNVYVRGIATVITGASGLATFGSGSTVVYQRFEQCNITFSGSASATARVNLQNSLSVLPRVIHDNCTITFNHASQTIVQTAVSWEWRNSSVAGTAPTTLFTFSAGTGFSTWVHSCDLSLVGSGQKLVTLSGANANGPIIFEHCKINNLATIASFTVNDLVNAFVILSKCDGGAVNYRDEVYQSYGTLTTETTVVRTSGESDGTTSMSRKVVTTSAATWLTPFDCPPIAVWCDTAGVSKTVTLYGIWGGGAVPNSDDFWIDVEYLGSSATPVGTITTTTKSDVLASGSALSSDTSTWGGSTTKFKTSVTITPQMKGYIIVRPRAGKASSTFYYDTKLDVV